MIRKSILTTLAVVAVLALGSPSAMSQGSGFSKLAGPGERLQLDAKRPADGGEYYLRSKVDEEGELIWFEGVGRVVLRSAKLDLDSDHLVYDAESGLMTATGNVVMRQPGVFAECGVMVYNLETEELRLTKSPTVEQTDERGGRNRFSGMEEFLIIQDEDGSTEVRMTGGDEIICEVIPPEESEEGTEENNVGTEGMNGPAADADEESDSRGFAGMGDRVRITTRPRGEKTAEVYVSAGEEGDFQLFRAEGSVVLESDQMDLRSDFLQYDAARMFVEALYNVYLKQEGVEADCGRMYYDLEKDIITLTISPFVRERSGGMVKTVSEMDSFIIYRFPDGSSTTHAVGGPDGEPRITWEPESDLEPATQSEPTGPVEIRLDQDEDMRSIRR